MKYLEIVLKMDLGMDAKDGPGWYIQAYADTGTMIRPLGISQEAAYQLAGAFQQALQSVDGDLPEVTFPQLAGSATGLITRALQDQLRYAETQAAKIPVLKYKLGQAPPNQRATG